MRIIHNYITVLRCCFMQSILYMYYDSFLYSVTLSSDITESVSSQCSLVWCISLSNLSNSSDRAACNQNEQNALHTREYLPAGIAFSLSDYVLQISKSTKSMKINTKR